MTNEEKFAFLDAKRCLIQPFVDEWQEHVLKSMFAHFIAVGITSRPQEDQDEVYRQVDQKLEKLIVEWLLDGQEAAIRSQLTEKFGITSFAEQPQAILRRILRRKKIRSEEEAKL